MEETPSSPSKNPLKAITTIILIIIGVVAIVWFVWNVFSEEEVQFNGGTVESPEKVVNDTGDTNADGNTNTEENKETDPEAKARDDQRITQVKEIQAALTSFFENKGNYPEKMEELVTERFLSELPQNPAPGGINYVYTPIGSLPAQYYDLAYSLEVGTDEVGAGDHIANPDSIAYP